MSKRIKTAETKARTAIKAIRLGQAGNLDADHHAAMKAIEKLADLDRVALNDGGEEALAALRATVKTLRAECESAVELRYAAAKMAIGLPRDTSSVETGWEREVRLAAAMGQI